jgi:MFS family permease
MGDPFRALRHRDFQWYFWGMITTASGTRMNDLAGSWFVYSLTGSALALGWLKTGWSVAILAFALLGGMVADRVNRRAVLVVGHGLLALVPLILVLLITTGAIRWWHIAVASLVHSLIFSFDMPAREAYLSTLLESGTLLNAMALYYVAMAVPGGVFAVVGGALVDSVGVTRVYLLVTLVFVLSAVLFGRLPSLAQASPPSTGMRDEFIEGLRYVTHHRTLMLVLGIGLGRTLLLSPSQFFLPVFAADVFRKGALGLGLLSAAWAVGRVIGSFGIASLGEIRRKGLILTGSGVLSGVSLILFAQSESFYLALLFLGLSAVTQAAYTVIETTVLQSATTPQMRGRVSGYLRLTWGLTPLAVLPMGSLIDTLGAPQTIALSGLLAVSFFVLGMVLWPSLRRLT